jgi:hypothetical protein
LVMSVPRQGVRVQVPASFKRRESLIAYGTGGARCGRALHTRIREFFTMKRAKPPLGSCEPLTWLRSCLFVRVYGAREREYGTRDKR